MMEIDSGVRALGGGPLAKGELVRLIYTDEAGTSEKEPVCVVASVLVHGDKEYRLLVDEIERIKRELLPPHVSPATFHIHGKELFNGGKNVDRDTWPFEERLDLFKQLICLPFVHDVPVAVGIEHKFDWTDVVKGMDKKITSNQYSHLLTFMQCMERSDHFLRTYLAGEEVGTVVAEDVPKMRNILAKGGLLPRVYQTTIPSEHMRADAMQKATGQKPPDYTVKISHIIDVPHFVEKGGAPLLQLADLCAFAFRRCLTKQKHGDDLVYAMLGPIDGHRFVNDPVWHEGASGGLFCVSKDLKAKVSPS